MQKDAEYVTPHNGAQSRPGPWFWQPGRPRRQQKKLDERAQNEESEGAVKIVKSAELDVDERIERPN